VYDCKAAQQCDQHTISTVGVQFLSLVLVGNIKVLEGNPVPSLVTMETQEVVETDELDRGAS
jgi:hypothetical protein